MTARTVLITGCSSGIGAAAARAFHAGGWAVYATARHPEKLGDLARLGIATPALDVLDEASMTAAVDEVQAGHGAVDVLVNNAGYAMQGPVEEAELDEARRQFETNVLGPVRLTQLVLPAMREKGSGRVINVSSMGGRFTFPGGGFYHASKHALEAVTDALRPEVRRFGVQVILVEPGPVLTEFADTAVETMGPDAQGAETSGPYGEFKARLAQRYLAAYDGRRSNLASTPDRVADVIVKAATTRRPRARYLIGPVARSLVGARRVLPDRAFDAAMRSMWPTP